MGGFGGALKNISIGIASTHGKTNIHTAGVTTEAAELFNNLPPQDHFLESMADACKAVISYKGAENMLYINVANRLSVDLTVTPIRQNRRCQILESLHQLILLQWIRHAMTQW